MSKTFKIKRRVRHRDSTSPILFNAALEDLMHKPFSKWSQKKLYGMKISSKRLTNSRFPHGSLALSLPIARQMLGDLMREAAAHGLEVHASKAKVLWNNEGMGRSCKRSELKAKILKC